MAQPHDTDKVLIGTRVRPEIKSGFEQMAEDNHRSVSKELERLIEMALVRPEESEAA